MPLRMKTPISKLSELAVGIGPFVVGPAIERKIGTSAFSQLAIDAGMWRNGDWARRKGLYAELHPTLEGMDESVARLANQLSHASPEAMKELKKIYLERHRSLGRTFEYACGNQRAAGYIGLYKRSNCKNQEQQVTHKLLLSGMFREAQTGMAFEKVRCM
jgi:hypothetical protein